MRQGATERTDNVLNIPQPPREPMRASEMPAQQSGQAIVSLLQQAADVARRNEERAKAQARHLADELRAAEERCRLMEARLRHFEARAQEAEDWLVRIHDEVQERLIVPFGGDQQGQDIIRRR
jgi:hypothetical protein